MTTPPEIPKPEIISRTTFYQGEDQQWYWQTKAINNEIVADGSEGYTALRNAMKGFFIAQGVEYEPLGTWPMQYGPLTKLPDNQYQINKYLSS